LTATYNGTLSKKTTITQTLEAPTVTFASTDNATVAAFDMVIEGQNPSSVTPMTSGGSISVGHWLALSVSPATGFEIDSVTVGGKATTAIATYYCYQITEADYNNELKVAVSVKSSSGEVVTTGTIVVDPATVDGCTIVTYGLLYDTMTYTQGTTIEQGQYVVVNVIPDTAHADYTIKVTVNDADTQDFTANWTGEGNLYCYLKKAVAGTTYTVKVTLTAPAAEPETPDAAAGTITAQTAEHVTSIKTYDYKLGDNSTLATESSTVTAGNYVAVEVECETGYVVDTVTVNGNATVQYGKYYCYKANAGEAYTVVVTAKQTPGTIAVTAVENATVKTYNYKLNDSTSVENESTTVDVGNFVAITVDCAEGYEVESVTVNGNATTLYGGKYYCYKATEAGATYTVVVTLRQVSAS
jgi:hypothetical protein